MDGEYKDNFATPFKYEGDSEGLSLGLTWSAPLTDNIGYFLDLRYQKYEMDGKDKLGGFSAGSTVDTDEQLLSSSAGIQWYF